MDALSRYMEVAVGASIVVIGATGLQEAREWRGALEECPVEPTETITMSEAGVGACGEPTPQGVTRTLLNGVLNGVSGTGHVLGVLPALAMPTWGWPEPLTPTR